MKRRTTLAVAAMATCALILTACAQKKDSGASGSDSSPPSSMSSPTGPASKTGKPSDTATPSESAPAGDTSAAPKAPSDVFTLPADKPAAAKEGFTVALVRQSGIGDYFEQWGNGAMKQLEAVGAKVTKYDARQDNAKMATDFKDAIAAKPDVIIVDHGLKATVDPLIDEAIGKGIPVVVYDVAIANQKAVYLSQDDEAIATTILGYLKKDNPDGGKIAYVNVGGNAPLDSRDKVYQQFLKDNSNFTQTVKFGKYSESVAPDTAAEGTAALQSSKDTTIVFAAYDEFAKGAMIALRNNSMTDVKVYGVDISTADIDLMVNDPIAWRATAATDPANVGAIVARAAIAEAWGVKLPSKLTIPAALITQDLLKEKKVTNMEQLRTALPELNTPDYLGATWIPTITPGS